MTKHNYPLYGLAVAAGAGVAVWSGFPPTLLLLLVCPAMMFSMMRGVRGGQNNHGAGQDRDDHADSGLGQGSETGLSRPSPPDGSHERIDHP